MSEVWVNQWEHRVGPASKWEAIFFQVEGIPTPVPWWTREAGPHQEAVTHEDMIAAASLLSKQPLPFKMEASFTEYPSKKNPGRTERRIDDWEIIDGGEHILTSVVAGKGADERPHSPPESEAATGPSPAAPPKATTAQEPVKGLREALERTHPSLTDNLAALMERCYVDARLAAKREIKPDTPPEVRASIITDVGTTARTLFIERVRRQK